MAGICAVSPTDRRLSAPIAVALLALLGTGLGACADQVVPAEGDAASWQMLAEDLDGALLSVWGSGADDVWFVGSDPGDGGGPYVVHYDGAGFERLDSGVDADLWWVYGDGQGDLWMSGSGGTILRYDTAAERFDAFATPSDAPIVFGVFPLPDGDVWAVGGAAGATPPGFVWRLEGETFVAVDDVPAAALEAGMLFKVWGRSADDLWVVGLGNVALHRTAAGWESHDVARRLFTVHGHANRAYAVGGFLGGYLTAIDGDAISDATPTGMPQMNGVWVAPDGSAVAVGVEGAIWRSDTAGAWHAEAETPETTRDYHAVYVDPSGAVWAVGGFVVSEPLHDGMLARFGAPIDAPAGADLAAPAGSQSN